GAAAQIAGEQLAEAVAGEDLRVPDDPARRHRDAGGARAALSRAVDQQGLERGGVERLDGVHPRAANLVGGYETRVHRQPVEPHRAGAALTFAAPFLRARQAEPLAQHVEQAIGGIYLDGRGRAVERERECNHWRRWSAFRAPRSAISMS